MPLTPNVVDGQIILASWGNAIRDRTIQQFTNTAELNAWAAPDGCTARTLDTGTLWYRRAGAWTTPPGVPVVRTGAASSGTCPVGITNLISVSLGAMPCSVAMLANVGVSFGFGGVAINAAPDLYSVAAGAVGLSVGAPYQAITGAGMTVPMNWYRTLSAGQTGDFLIRLNVTAMSSGACTWFANYTVIAFAT